MLRKSMLYSMGLRVLETNVFGSVGGLEKLEVSAQLSVVPELTRLIYFIVC